jgi:hypothetical protein
LQPFHFFGIKINLCLALKVLFDTIKNQFSLITIVATSYLSHFPHWLFGPFYFRNFWGKHGKNLLRLCQLDPSSSWGFRFHHPGIIKYRHLHLKVVESLGSTLILQTSLFYPGQIYSINCYLFRCQFVSSPTSTLNLSNASLLFPIV